MSRSLSLSLTCVNAVRTTEQTGRYGATYSSGVCRLLGESSDTNWIKTRPRFLARALVRLTYSRQAHSVLVCFYCSETSPPPPPSPPPRGDAAQSHSLNTPPRTKACIIYSCVDVLYLSAHCAPTK